MTPHRNQQQQQEDDDNKDDKQQQQQPSSKRPCEASSFLDTANRNAKLQKLPAAIRFSQRLRASKATTTTTSTSAVTSKVSTSPRRFTFGVMADIQYAPIPDGFSYAGVPRYYRHSLEVAEHAARHFQNEQVPLVVNLGDIIDGKCQDTSLIRDAAILNAMETSMLLHEQGNSDNNNAKRKPGLFAMNDVLRALSAYTLGPILHTYGNHELYNLDRPTLGTKLGIPFVQEPCGDLVGYHSYLHDGIRFVVLDTYDIAKLQRCPNTSCKYREACNILQQSNPNYPRAENSPSGLTGLGRRFVAFNGAVGLLQLEWLRTTLHTARSNQEKVILLSHQPILPGSSSPVCLVWNYPSVLNVLREFSDVIIASLAGHAHKGGYKRDPQSGIHFRVIEAVLENPAPHKTYGFIDVHEDCLVVRGYGNCTSSVYDFEHMSRTTTTTTTTTTATQQQQQQAEQLK